MLCYLIRMSFVIEDLPMEFTGCQTNKKSRQQVQSPRQEPITNNRLYQNRIFIKEQTKDKNKVFINFKGNQFFAYTQLNANKQSVLLSAKGQIGNSTIICNVVLMDEYGEYLKVNVQTRQSYFFRYLVYCNSMIFPNNVCIRVDSKTNVVYLSLITLNLMIGNESKYIFKVVAIMQKLLVEVKEIFKNYSIQLEIMKRDISRNDQKFSHFQRTNNKGKLNLKLNQLQRIYGIFLNFGDDTHPRNINQDNAKFEKASIQFLFDNIVKIQKQLLGVQILYTDFSKIQEISKNIVSLTEVKKMNWKSQINFIQMSKFQNSNQNLSILNYIKINQKQSKLIQNLTQSVLSKLYIYRLQFWYVSSCKGNPTLVPGVKIKFNQDKLLKKYIVVKQQKTSNQLNFSRIFHEQQILKQFKNGQSIYVPKYYIEQQFSLKNNPEDPLASKSNISKLYSDFVNFPNLSVYTSNNKNTISLITKIHILYNIAQGLRYLHSYGIAHRDFKPSNLLIQNSHMIKIIDFGESFHSNTQYQIPGYTMPYSAPQIYRYQIYSCQSNDIFSLGVIAFELIFGRYPFYFADRRIFETNQFVNYFNINFEQLRNYSEPIVFYLLLFVIVKCLQPEQFRRPQLNWICLIFKHLLSYLAEY